MYIHFLFSFLQVYGPYAKRNHDVFRTFQCPQLSTDQKNSRSTDPTDTTQQILFSTLMHYCLAGKYLSSSFFCKFMD